MCLLLCSGEVSEDAVSYCERFLELLTDLEAQLPSRRFFNTLLNDSHLVVRKVHREFDLYMLCFMCHKLHFRFAVIYPILLADSQKDTCSNRCAHH